MLVVGCGPVGVMTALRCVQRGLRVIAIDRSTEIYPLPRALGMDDEVQQLFHRAGLGEELRSHSSPLRGGEFVDAEGRRVVGIEQPEGAVGSLGLPHVVAFDQPGVERFLRRAAAEAGVEVRLGVDALAIDDDGEHLRATVDDGRRRSTITARWLVAADGAKSTIRSLLDVALVDQGFDQTWLVVDTALRDPDLPLPHLARQLCDPDRIATFVPGHGLHRRWEFRLRADETREEVLDQAVIASLLAPWGSEDQLEVRRAAVYRFHATVAEAFRRGRAFLAGDAAHQMPPFNGQGMCTGMRDAENLSWKLAAVAGGHSPDALLDTYDAERRPHAAGQVAHSVDAGLLIEAIAYDGEAALESGYGQRPFPRLEGKLFDGDHRPVGRVLPAPAAPHPPLGDGWTLLRPAEAATPGQSGDCGLPEVWRRVGAEAVSVDPECYPGLVEAGTTVVVRPDRYVAAVTTDLAATTDRFAPVLDGAPS